jgi:hypothetical protein
MAGKGSPKGVKQGGRKPGTPNKATAEIKTLARTYCAAAMVELARLSTMAESEQARVAAIKEIFDRGYGKSTQLIGGDPDASPIVTRIENVIIDNAKA